MLVHLVKKFLYVFTVIYLFFRFSTSIILCYVVRNFKKKRTFVIYVLLYHIILISYCICICTIFFHLYHTYFFSGRFWNFTYLKKCILYLHLYPIQIFTFVSYLLCSSEDFQTLKKGASSLYV